MSPERLALILDWSGSVVMLNSFWSWVYTRARPRLQAQLKRGERRREAFIKLITKRYGSGFSNLDFVERLRAHDEWTGYSSAMSWWMRLLFWYQERKIYRRLCRYGVATAEDHAIWEKRRGDKKRRRRLMLGLAGEVVSILGRRFSLWAADQITFRVLQGRGAALLFAIGFAIWNISKLMSLRALP